MKLKKKILSIILAIFMFAPCMFMLTACGGGNGHTHEWSATYTKDASQHWKKCTGCDETTEKENHTFNVDTCTVCGYVDSSRTPAQKGVMSNYFSGVKATYTKENFLDSNNQAREFKDLVDRQIDVLAQDILTRLNYVYGDLRTSKSKWLSSPALTDAADSTGDYRYYGKYEGGSNGLAARVETAALLTTLSESDYNALDDDTLKLTEINIDSLEDYQKSLVISNTSKNYLALERVQCLIGAANGGSMKIDYTDDFKVLMSDENKKWAVTDLTSEDAKNSLKLLIAQEITKNSDTDYDSLLNEINKLGFEDDFEKALENIINNSIIGNDRITEDMEYYNILKKDYHGIINFANTNAINSEEKYNTNYSPRLFKGYNIVVPALVKSALNNKFENTDVSLYPKFSKKAVNYTSNANGFSEAHAYDTITLLAKANTLYTKLVVKIKGSDITESATLEYQVVVNGEAVGTKQNITLTNDSQELEISIAKTGTFGDFDGTTDVDTNNKIFENVQVDDRNTSNYITIEFTNASGVKFVVTFDGYYNK